MYKFRIKAAANGQYRTQFLYNNEIMVWSENYTTKVNAQNAINSVKTSGSCAPIVDLTIGQKGTGYRWEIVKSTNGQYFTRLIASNGETIVWSETYTVKHNAINSAESVKANAPDATVIDETIANVA